MVRHETLTLASVGSNPASPAKTQSENFEKRVFGVCVVCIFEGCAEINQEICRDRFFIESSLFLSFLISIEHIFVKNYQYAEHFVEYLFKFFNFFAKQWHKRLT